MTKNPLRDTKIVMIAPSVMTIPPESYGGIEQCIHDLYTKLEKMGIDITLVAPIGSKASKLIPTIEPTREWKDEEKKAFDVYWNKLGEFDLIIDHTHQAFSYLIRDKKIVKVLYGLSTWHSPPPRNYPNLITHSEYHRGHTLGKIGKDSKVINLGVNPNKYTFSDVKDNYYLCLSVMLPHKGHLIAIDWAKKHNEHLIIAGEDVDRVEKPYVETVKSMCYGGNVDYSGRVSNEMKVDLLSHAKGLILPFFSVNEAWSLLAVESLMCGTPCFSSTLGAMPEIIRNRNVGVLFNTKESFVNDPLNYDFNPHEIRKFAMKHFTSEIMARKHVDIYRKVIFDNEVWG